MPKIGYAKVNLSKINTKQSENKSKSPYNLTDEQEKIYNWLKNQGLNVDDDTLNYWVRKYPSQRLMNVVQFAHKRRAQGEQIRNIGGWIHKLLKDDATVITEDSQNNRQFTNQFAEANGWKSLHIYEKYIKDEIMGEDLPLTMPQNEFRRSLEALYRRMQLYRD